MAKRRAAGISSHKQKINRVFSQQTAQKLSTAAKGRRRIRGRFASEGGVPRGPDNTKAKARRPKGALNDSPSNLHQEMRSYMRDLMDSGDYTEKTAARQAVSDYKLRYHESLVPPAADLLKPAPERVTTGRIAEMRREHLAGGKWKKPEAAGSFKDDTMSKPMKHGEFLSKRAPADMQEWYIKAIQPGGALTKTPQLQNSEPNERGVIVGADRKARKMLELQRTGRSFDEAYNIVMSDNRGRPPSPKTKRRTGLEDRGYSGRGSKTERLTPTASKLEIGVTGKRLMSKSALAQENPDLSPGGLVEVRHNQRANIAEEILKNQRWGHETKRASILGERGRRYGPDRVTLFTTSVGKPEVSVPTDSVVGQYIIRKRKRFAKQQGIYPDSQLRGRFPEAVRDLHIIDVATNRTVGAEGAYGLYKRSGWRVGGTASKNYGKPIAVGSQIMYNNSGTPMYDQHGRVRFTEGATREFKINPRRGLGFGVYVG